LDLVQIRYFLALARTLNFTRTAEQCHVTQPALTKSIQRLEEELGGSLLLRERSHTQLTALGGAMLPLLQQTYDAAEAARLGARQFREQTVARLRLGLGAWIDLGVVTPLLQQVTRRFPGVEFTIRRGETPALNEWLLGSEIDVTLTAEADKLTDRANRWEVFADPVVALLPEDHKLAGPDTLRAEMLHDEALVGRLDRADAEFESYYGMMPAIRHRGSTEEHVHAIIQAALGIGFSTARQRLPAGIVRRTLEPARHLDVVVAAIAGRPMSAAAAAFLRLARARDWGAGFG